MKTIHNDTTAEKIIQTAVRIIEREGYESLSLKTIGDDMEIPWVNFLPKWKYKEQYREPTNTITNNQSFI